MSAAFNATGFTSKHAPEAIPLHFADLAALAGLIRETTSAAKADLPWIKLARFSGIPNPDSRSTRPAARYNAGLDAISGVEGDYDAKPKADGGLMAIEEAAGLIERAGIEALLSETPSSTPQKPHWRVLCPTSREYRTDLDATRTRFLARVNGVLGGVLASESFTLSQSYYFGSIEGKPPIEPTVIRGERIDLLSGLDAGAVYKNGSNQPDVRREPLAAPDGLIESADDPDLIAVIREQIASAIERDGVGETPTGARAFSLVTWLLKLRVGDKIIEPEALQAILAEDWRDVADDLVENALAAIGDERGSVVPCSIPETANCRTGAEAFGGVLQKGIEIEQQQRIERAMARVMESPTDNLSPEDAAQVENFRGKLRKPAGREVMLGSLEALIADLNDKPRSRFGFGGRRPSEGKHLPDLTYFDTHKTLPKVPDDGAVGFAIGTRGNHKSGVLVKYGLDACDAGYRVLFVAAEGARGIEKRRVPAAIDARGHADDHYDELWITEAAPLVLRSPQHRADLIATYRNFKPDLVIIDVLAKTIPGADVNAAKDAGEIVVAMEEIARGFGGATVIATRHPPLATEGRGTGSNEFVSLAFFQWLISEAGGVVTLHVDKMKDGADNFEVRYKVDRREDGTPVIADATEADLAETARRTVQVVGPDEIVADAVELLSGIERRPISMSALTARLRELPGGRYDLLAEGDLTKRLRNAVWGGSHKGRTGRPSGPLAPYARIDGCGTSHAVYQFQAPGVS